MARHNPGTSRLHSEVCVVLTLVLVGPVTPVLVNVTGISLVPSLE